MIYQNFITVGHGGFALYFLEYFFLFLTVPWNAAGVCYVPAAGRDSLSVEEKGQNNLLLSTALNCQNRRESGGRLSLLPTTEWHATSASLVFSGCPSGHMHGYVYGLNQLN